MGDHLQIFSQGNRAEYLLFSFGQLAQLFLPPSSKFWVFLLANALNLENGLALQNVHFFQNIFRLL